ncbi:MAG TPA: DUF559 domain-containing protein [Intrasporangium sp.]|uniref:DUF559 domain-containing protein n=1 Tax=Intrasporangium sp. TaxID=1925024 RepID=UPI002B48CFF2|nr:DUF559 domain-containing protein [Intrasporangium sp.]HKX66883.1 DUF559 domain-containing protein [Intrasporangium sp.]
MPSRPLPLPPTMPFRVTVTRNRDESTGRVKRSLHLPPGVTEWELRNRRYRKLFHGVYVHRDTTITEWMKAFGALLLCAENAAASHHTAARIWGGVVPDDGHVHLSIDGSRRKVLGIHAHRVKVGGQECSRLNGLRLTSPRQSFLDLGGELGLVDLVVLGDSLVKAARVTPEELVAAAKTFRGRGQRLLRRAASLVRRDVDSPMESRVRMLMVLAGLPEPTINHKILWPDGSVRYRFDLSYPRFRLVIEYDGRQHAESDRQWDGDIDRREWMDGDNWRIVIVRSKDIYNTPGQTLQRIISAMRDKGMAVPRLSDEWRLHFPGRMGDVAEPA